MDPRLLHHYNLELQHLREMGAEFAQQFPKIARRLGMDGLEVADPYVERLLEGTAFLAARVQLKLDAELPRFTQALLEIVYPHFLSPTPSMLVAQFLPDYKESQLATGTKVVPRGSALFSRPAGEAGTACEFRTAHPVTLWPVQITSASYFSFAPELPLTALPYASRIKGGLRIRLQTTTGVTFSQLPLDRLSFHATGRTDVATALCELCLGHALGTLVAVPPQAGTSTSAGRVWRATPLAGGSVRPMGLADDHALLPGGLRSFHGYRLLQEYFSFPERYRFFELTDLAGGLRSVTGNVAELVVLFGRGDAALERLVDASNLGLFCTPAINLFPKRLDRVTVTDGSHEYHVVPDRTRPVDFEVHSLTRVVGHSSGAQSEQTFEPFYAAHTGHAPDHTAYYTVRREPRLLSAGRKRTGPRSSYVGSEMFVSLVDPRQAPFSGELRQLAVHASCTNRDLPLHMPYGIKNETDGLYLDLSLDISVPVADIRVVAGPSRPHGPLADGAVAWRGVNHLSLNYYSLVDSTPDEGAAALRELLRLYADGPDRGLGRQVEGIRRVGIKPVVRRLPGRGPIAFGRGLEITVTVDPLAFEGGSAYLLGAVLNEYFARHVSMNAFTETVLVAEGRGELHRWAPGWGARPTL